MPAITHRTVQTNGIKMHVAEAGEGPLVVLLHGWPESWYSWRHQLVALAEAGYHAVAPDQRGYGQTDRPEGIDQYSQLHLVGDVVGLLDALGEEQAVVVGHDWGAPVAWNSALLRPDRFRAVAGLSVPYSPRGSTRPTDGMRALFGQNFFYILYFQEPGQAERELEADVRGTLRKLLYSASGSIPPDDVSRGPRPNTGTFLETMRDPDSLPDWLAEADLDFFEGEFKRAGFRGGLNWYRNIDRNWELLAAWHGAKIRVPALFISGDRDPVIAMNPAGIQGLATHLPQLRGTVLLPGAGHWTQQERPEETNKALIEFLGGL